MCFYNQRIVSAWLNNSSPFCILTKHIQIIHVWEFLVALLGFIITQKISYLLTLNIMSFLITIRFIRVISVLILSLLNFMSLFMLSIMKVLFLSLCLMMWCLLLWIILISHLLSFSWKFQILLETLLIRTHK